MATAVELKFTSQSSSRFWSKNQPDNGGQNQEFGKEDCVHLTLWTKTWNDVQCNNSMKFICEIL